MRRNRAVIKLDAVLDWASHAACFNLTLLPIWWIFTSWQYRRGGWVSRNGHPLSQPDHQIKAVFTNVMQSQINLQLLEGVLRANGDDLTIRTLQGRMETAENWLILRRLWPVGGWARTLSPSDPTICLGLEWWIPWTLRAYAEAAALHEIVHAAQEVREGAMSKEWEHSQSSWTNLSVRGFISTICYEYEANRVAHLAGVCLAILATQIFVPPMVVLGTWTWRLLA